MRRGERLRDDPGRLAGLEFAMLRPSYGCSQPPPSARNNLT